MRQFRVRRSSMTLAALLMVLVACSSSSSGSPSGSSTPGGQPQQGGEVTMLIHEPTAPNLDKLRVIVQGVFWVTEDIFEALTFVDGEGNLQPLLDDTPVGLHVVVHIRLLTPEQWRQLRRLRSETSVEAVTQ